MISVNGIGPSIALVALSSVQPQQLMESIAKEDVRSIQTLKGIGPKTAQRLILELKDKMKKEMPVGSPIGVPISAAGKVIDDALSALTTLGLPKATAEKILDSIMKLDPKSYTTEELIHGIKAVLAGRRYLSESIAENLADYMAIGGCEFPHEFLSAREYEVFILIAKGRAVSEIGAMLSLSTKTVSTYRTRILEKMSLRSNGELMRYALQHGLVK